MLLEARQAGLQCRFNVAVLQPFPHLFVMLEAVLQRKVVNNEKMSYCAEEIQDAAIVCRYCGRDLVTPSNSVPVPSGPAKPVQQPQAKQKQPYALAAIVVLLLCCGLIFSMTSSKTSRTNPTPTSQEVDTRANSVVINTVTPLETITPEPTNTPKATSTPKPTRTPEPTVDAYVLLAQQKFLDFQDAFLDVYSSVDQMSNDPTLVLSTDWKTETGPKLGVLNFRADEMSKLEPSPEFETFHSYFVEIAKKTHLFTNAFAQGVDNFDSDSINRATQHIRNVTALMELANTELERISNIQQ